MRRPTVSTVATLLAVGGAVVFVVSQLEPGLLLRDTTPAGGDMGAHVWGPAYLRDNLLPHGRLSGWAPDWYAGFPYPTFYFPVPALIVLVGDLVLPYSVALKLVSVAGLVTLPVAAWAFGRLAGLRQPAPACLAVATVPFLFDRGFTIYGGNIASTLAGEFSFSISLSVALLFLGVLARGLDGGRHRALAASLLALTALCHLLPAMFAVVGGAVLVLLRPSLPRLRHGLTVGLVGGLLAAFWALPFLARLPYTNDMGWEKIETYRDSLFPRDARWLLVLAAAGVLVSLVFRIPSGTFLSALAVLAAAAFVLAPQARLWNARFLPFWFLCLYLLAGLAVAELGRGLGGLLLSGEGSQHTGQVVTPVVALAAAVAFVATPLHTFPAWARWDTDDRSFIPSWVRWNYSGYEAKPSYGEYQDVVATMDKVGREVGCGRALWEYEPELDRLGTPMALMLLPYWTGGCIGSMEGLFFEAAATTPYHFLAQAELSAVPSRPQRDLPYRDLDVARGVEHLQLLGVRYYMALSPRAHEQARRHPDLRLVASSGPWDVRYEKGTEPRTWEVYEVANSDVVAPLAYEPVVGENLGRGGDAWLEPAVEWYQDPAALAVPMAATGPKRWRRVSSSSPEPPRRPLQPVRVSEVRVGTDRISFEVDRPGTPVLVKASYFPNWRASGAEGPFRVTPNLMVVVPTGGHVELRYAIAGVERAGWVLSLLGLAAVVVLGWRAATGRARLRRAPARRPMVEEVTAARPTPGSGVPDRRPVALLSEDDG